MKGYRNLLVTADSSQRALREGLRVAEEEGCDLIIMGVKKRAGFLRRLFDGNLVHRVARGAPCSVMIVDA